MKGERNYRKGEKVWLQMPVEGEQNRVRPAEVISALSNGRLIKDKTHIHLIFKEV